MGQDSTSLDRRKSEVKHSGTAGDLQDGRMGLGETLAKREAVAGAVEPRTPLASFDQAMLWALALVRPLTIPEAAFFMRCREGDVLRMIRRHELRSFKRGRRRYVLVEDVRAKLIADAQREQARNPRTARVAADLSGASETMLRLFA
jgi:hypothetical protein